MGGSATFSGTTYQQRVAAYIAAHILARSRLCWFESQDDTPGSYSAETGGTGDDISVVLLGDPSQAFEVQAKHGLTGGAKLRDTITTIARKFPSELANSTGEVVIVVDGSTSGVVRHQVAGDLNRLRSGRRDGLTPETTNLLDSTADRPALLQRIRIRCVDVERDDTADSKNAMLCLGSALKDRSQSILAWALLIEDAGTVCARRLARTRVDLVALLEAKGIAVQPVTAEEHRYLDFCRDLLRQWHLPAARDNLASFEARLTPAARSDPDLRYRLQYLQAHCALQERRFTDAIELATRAATLKPDGLDAIRTIGYAYLENGNIDQATRFAARAVAVAPFEPTAWVLRVQVDAAAGRSQTKPPAAIGQDVIYRAAEAQVARNMGDWQRVSEITTDLIREGGQDPDVLILRAESLLESNDTERDANNIAAERLCSDALEILQNESDPRVHRALSLRASCFLARGDNASADADIARLREIVGDRPDILEKAAIVKRQGGDVAGALSLLQSVAIDGEPGLLAQRAQLKRELGHSAAAHHDARRAFETLTNASPVETTLVVAEALLDVGEIADCRALLARPGIRGLPHTLRLVLSGRVAFEETRSEDAIAFFRSAADADASRRRSILFELAWRLYKANDSSRAVQTIIQYKDVPLNDRELRLLATCLFAANRLTDVETILTTRFVDRARPDWALLMTIDVALRREDADGAIDLLRQLLRSDASSFDHRLQLARLLFEENRHVDARAEALAILAIEPLPPIVRMRAAILLAHLRCPVVALAAAHRSYREARQDPRMHQGLVMVSSASHAAPAVVDQVGPDTFVRLKRDDDSREYTVLSLGPVDPTRNELTIDDAQAMNLLGKRVGESIQTVSVLGAETWIVDEILTAPHHDIQTVYRDYEKNFPTKPFLASVPAPTDSVGDILPLLRVLDGKKDRENQVLIAFRRGLLPLGWAVSMLRVSIPALFAKLAADEPGRGIPVEWPEPIRQAESVATAVNASEIVVTRSALESVCALKLLDTLLRTFTIVAPRSLLRTLEDELREAQEMVTDGRTVVGPGDTGLVVNGLPPDHPALVAHRDQLSTLIAWCREHLRFETRPLESIENPASDSSIREAIGRDSWDAVELACYRGIPLYADDLGLRRLRAQCPSFSSPAFVVALAERAAIKRDDKVRLLHTLAIGGYLWPPATPDLLLGALERAGELDHGQIRRVFGILAGMPTIGEAAMVVAKTLKLVANPRWTPKTGH